MTAELVFVTGASGFLAAHIIQELVAQGFRVRGSARGKKVAALKSVYASTPNVEIVEIADIAHGQFADDIFQGVTAVIHTASPLPGREDVEGLLKSAIEGSLNVLRQAEKAGIRKFVVTSSIVAVVRDPKAVGTKYRAEHWNPITKADATPENQGAAYAVAKKYAELAVWEWADAHPHVDVTTINPPLLYGPFAPLSLPIAPGDFMSFSTNLMVYNLLTPSGTFAPSPGYADVRDVARAHVGALHNPSLGLGAGVADRKRVVFASPHAAGFDDLLAMIQKERPQIGDRLIKSAVPQFPFNGYDVDFAKIEELAGMKKEDFHTLKQTFLDTIDNLLEVERVWKEKGYVVAKVPVMGV